MPSSPPSPAALRTITIAIADDHRMVRSALRALLESQEDFEVVADVGDAAAALRSVLDERPDVLVLDLIMPGDPTALECIPLVREGSPETAIVVLTMQNDPAFARRAFRLGARAYVLKESADEELVQAVRRAAAGRRYLDPQLEEGRAASPAGGVGGLTPRELEVLRLIAMGHTNAEIAVQLVLSVRTIESHRSHIQRKLGRPRRTELVRYALDHHLLDG
jgi:two-component system, NarL family, response regulator NreC